MIEPLTEGEMLYPIKVGNKINEIIDAVNEMGTSVWVQSPYSRRGRPTGGGDIPPPTKPFNWAEQTERMGEDDGA